MANTELENQPAGEVNSQAAEPKMNNKQKTRLIVSTVLVLLLVAFVIQNYNKVKVEFLMFEFRVRIVMIILVSALIGSLVTFLLMRSKNSKKKK